MISMRMTEIVIPVKVGKYYRIVIPAKVRDHLNINCGDTLIMTATSGTIILRVVN